MWRGLKLAMRACSSSAKATGPSASSSSGSKSSSWNLYGRLLEQHPIKAKMISSGVIMGSGDFTCQWLTRRAGEADKGMDGDVDEAAAGFDWYRTAKFVLMGSVVIGPTLHHW
jgi:hypothetical protein